MRKIWHKWVKIADKIGNFQIIVIFSVLYFILVLPIGIISQVGYDFFNKKKNAWVKMKDNTSSLEKLHQQ